MILTEETIENCHPVRIDPIDALLKDKVDLMLRASHTAFEESKEIEKVSVTMSSVKQHVQISNSDGKLVQDTRVRTRMACAAYASDGTTLQSGTASPGRKHGTEIL